MKSRHDRELRQRRSEAATASEIQEAGELVPAGNSATQLFFGRQW
jgi:hypothetical protein